MTKSKRNQIEEMARAVCWGGTRNEQSCEECMNESIIRPYECEWKTRVAEVLYDAGYRKQSEGENITENHPVDEFICSECGLIMRDCGRYEIDEDDGDEILYEFAFRFCPRCGMKVRGD